MVSSSLSVTFGCMALSSPLRRSVFCVVRVARAAMPSSALDPGYPRDDLEGEREDALVAVLINYGQDLSERGVNPTVVGLGRASRAAPRYHATSLRYGTRSMTSPPPGSSEGPSSC